MAGFILGAYLLWSLAEFIYKAIVRKLKPALGNGQLDHHMRILCAWVTINTFYLFAGRPNINLMPYWLPVAMNPFIVGVSTIWMARNIVRNPREHSEESLAAALRGRLKQSAEAIKDFTRGRSVDELSAGEVNILAKVLKSE